MNKQEALDIITRIIVERNEYLEYRIDGQMCQQFEIPSLLNEIKESAQAVKYIKEHLK